MFIGIDLGTSSVKTILIDENQKIIENVSKSIDLINNKPGYFEQDPNTWFTATIDCFQKLKESFPKEFKSTKSIGISGQMHGATLIDRDNNILRPCILWNDTRSASFCTEMENSFSSIRKISGNITMPGFTAPKILWIKKYEPDIFKKIYKILLPKDYLRLKLTNSYYTEMSDASGTLWLNVKERKWSEELLNLTYLNSSHMPQLVEGSEPTETLSSKIKDELGFDNEVILAGGAGDQAAGAIGSGVIDSNQSMISLGTSGVYFSPTDSFSSNTNHAVHSFCHCIPNTWHHMSVMLSATNCLNWISSHYNLKIEEAINRAKNYLEGNLELNSTPFFLPYLSGERTPHNNPYLRGAFHKLSNLTEVDSMIYAVIEGISFGIKDGYESVHSISPKNENTYLIGGGSRSSFWAHLISSALNQKILIGQESEFGPALGAARLAMLATKKYDKNEIIKDIKVIKESFSSKKLSEKLQYRFKIWKEIVNVNKQIAKKIIEA